VSEVIGGAVLLLVFGGLVVFLAGRVSRRLGAKDGPLGAAAPWLFLAFLPGIMLAHLAGEHWGPGAMIAVLLGLLAALLGIPAWLARRERPRPKVELTPDYSFEDGPDWLVIAAGAVPFILLIGGVTVARSSLGAAIVLGAVAVSVVVLTTLLMRWRRRRQRAIIEAVERQADSLDPAELESLVERLELEHGKLEMRRLRQLVRERRTAAG
jgi:hypothetical protein